MIVIGNKRIIRFGVSVTYDDNSAANRFLNQMKLFTVGKQVQFLFDKFETRIEYESRKSIIMGGVESLVNYARLTKIFENIGQRKDVEVQIEVMILLHIFNIEFSPRLPCSLVLFKSDSFFGKVSWEATRSTKICIFHPCTRNGNSPLRKSNQSPCNAARYG